MNKMMLFTGPNKEEAALLIVHYLGEMLKLHSPVIAVLRSSTGKTRAEVELHALEDFITLFNSKPMRSMIEEEGPISFIEPDLNTGILVIGYMPKGTMAKMENATLQ